MDESFSSQSFYSDTTYDESELDESSETNEDSLSSEALSSMSESWGDSSMEEGDPDSPATGLDPDLNQPLYIGSQLSTWESHLLIMRYALCHSLTKQAVGDLLNLVGSHLPTKSTASVYKIRKFFLNLYEDISFTKHYCCSVCHCPFDNAGDDCRNGCGSSTTEFLAVSVEAQLKRKLEGNICV